METIGTTLPEWDMIQALPARGSNVSLAKCQSTGGLVFVTQCSKDLADAARPAVGRRLQHITELLCARANETGGACLVTSWVTGMTLEEHVLLHGAVEPGRALCMLDALVQGLDALHGCGAVHGFVSPRSVVLTDSDAVVLTHAAPTDDPRWRSPERLLGGGPSAADDVWGAHITMLQAVAGRPLLARGVSPQQVLSAVQESALRRVVDAVHHEPLRHALREGLMLAFSPAPAPTVEDGSHRPERTPPPDRSPITEHGEHTQRRAAAPPTRKADPQRTMPRPRPMWIVGLAGAILVAVLVVASFIALPRLVVASNGAQTVASNKDHVAATAPVASKVVPSASRSTSPAPPVSASASPAVSVSDAPPSSSVDACVRRHFLPDAMSPHRPATVMCDQHDPRKLTAYVASSLVFASDGRVTEAMQEWSRLQGFQPVVLAMIRAQCCDAPAGWKASARAEQGLWEATHELAEAVRTRQPAGEALAQYHRRAVQAGSAWWYAAPPCTGGQRWFDRFAARNGWPANTGAQCRQMLSR
ncbi:MAG: hypothetical protein ACOC1F_04630 [Myxococcota bacterium]